MEIAAILHLTISLPLLIPFFQWQNYKNILSTFFCLHYLLVTRIKLLLSLIFILPHDEGHVMENCSNIAFDCLTTYAYSILLVAELQEYFIDLLLFALSSL